LLTRLSLIIASTVVGLTAAEAKLKVVSTTPDLDALVQVVGGSEVESSAIAKGTQDEHQIEAKPSFMVRLRDANLVLAQGLELESAWLGPLVQGARNPKIKEGTKGFYELGPELEPLEVPKGGVSRAEGDVHPGGNPHFQLDPIRMGKAAVLIAERLGELDAANKAKYLENAKALQSKLEAKTKDWKARIEKSGVKELVTYHKSFTYFLDRFGLKAAAQLEPKPGIPPTASHVMEVIGVMKEKNLRLVLIENYFDASVGEKIKQSVPKAMIERVPVAVGGEPAIRSTEDLIERLVKTVEAAKTVEGAKK
jgi:zinc/manganese transport system substrate-binding protein